MWGHMNTSSLPARSSSGSSQPSVTCNGRHINKVLRIYVVINEQLFAVYYFWENPRINSLSFFNLAICKGL